MFGSPGLICGRRMRGRYGSRHAGRIAAGATTFTKDAGGRLGPLTHESVGKLAAQLVSRERRGQPAVSTDHAFVATTAFVDWGHRRLSPSPVAFPLRRLFTQTLTVGKLRPNSDLKRWGLLIGFRRAGGIGRFGLVFILSLFGLFILAGGVSHFYRTQQDVGVSPFQPGHSFGGSVGRQIL